MTLMEAVKKARRALVGFARSNHPYSDMMAALDAIEREAATERDAARDRWMGANSALIRIHEIAGPKWEPEQYTDFRNRDAIMAVEDQASRVASLEAALAEVEAWKMPPATNRDGKPSTFAAQYGSNGEREYIRGIARAALRGGGK